MDADIVIVGGGIAGLRCGIELLHRSPKKTIVILEKYNYMGGRVVSFRRKLEDVDGHCANIAWENGAGRIANSHTKVRSLIKKYGLTLIPIGDAQTFITDTEEDAVPNTFEDTLASLLPLLKQLGPSVLRTTTLEKLLHKILGNDKASHLISEYPYCSEVVTLRADLGIEAFTHEMSGHQGFSVVKEGLSALIKAMCLEFEHLGGTIFKSHEVTEVRQDGQKISILAKIKDTQVLWNADSVIMALHVDALRHIKPFQSWDMLTRIQMEPLLRTYAVFPIEEGRAWFSDLTRFVTPGPVRYFIPMNPACGSVMISYTDGQDARHYLNVFDHKGEEELEQVIMKDIRKLFPSRDIPEPLFFKAHPWYSGCSYWLPGDYDVKKASIEALRPWEKDMPGVFVCGESFSLRQAWMEGALEHADLLLEKYSF
jgi:protoporphyrinogen oxidase